MPGTTTIARERPWAIDRRKREVGTIALAMLLGIGANFPAGAGTTFEATYSISLAGLTIGTASAEGHFTETGYAATIEGRTIGISRLISDARARLAGSGRISGTRPLPASYDLETSEGDFETHVRMKMLDGTVTELLAIPRLRDHPDRIPLEAAHRRDVVDPVAAFLIVADRPGIEDGQRICQRTIEVFDGWQRYDVRLAFKESRKVDGADGDYDGNVVVCTARYVPVSGHRMSVKATRYMTENKRLEVWYAPIGGIRLLVPFRILIGTKFGDLVVASTRFVATDAAANPATGN